MVVPQKPSGPAESKPRDLGPIRLTLIEDKVDRLLTIVEGNGRGPILNSLTALEKDVAALQETVSFLRKVLYGVTAFLLVSLFELFRATVLVER